jgi:hypothetical protein
MQKDVMELIIAVLALVILTIVLVSPFYILINLILWSFHSSVRLTFIQCVLIWMLLTVIYKWFFNNNDGGN